MREGSITRREARKDDRRRAILAAAEASFFECGYAGTSMSAIASTLGGSKATLWGYFPSKAHLFEALLDSKIGDFETALDAALLADAGVTSVLHRFGCVFLTNVLRPDFIAMRRLVDGEGGRFPEVAAAMYERGPRRVRHRLAIYIAERMDAGALRDGDATVAARQFLALCQAISFNDRLWHRPDAPEPDPAGDVAHAVDSFVRAWGAVSPTETPLCSARA